MVSFFYASVGWGSVEQLQQIKLSENNSTLLKYLETLSSDEFSGRKFSSQASIQSQSYLISTLKTLAVPPFKNQYQHPFTQSSFFQTKQGTNIIAHIPGTHYSDQFIILSAHYDHLGIKGNRIYNGADDNASGVAALLHYAKLIKQKPLKHSVIVLFSDGEEVNLLGAKAFVTQQKSLLNKIRLNINLDMIAGSKKTKKLRFISKELNKILSIESLEGLNEQQIYFKNNSFAKLTSGFRNTRSSGSSLKRTNWLMASDHGIFSQAGIPFIYYGVGPHKNYHTENDNFEHINSRFFLAATDVIFQQLVFLDNAMVNTDK